MWFNVLWIEDDYSIVDAYQTIAEEEYNIDLIHRGNWEDGKKYLIENFNEITAIILDANCKLKSMITATITHFGKCTCHSANISRNRHLIVI